MARQWFRRTWVLLSLAAVVLLIIFFVKLTGRQPIARVAVVHAVRENISATILSNGKVEPVSPHPLRALFPTFVEKVVAVEGRAIKRGQLILTLQSAQVQADLARAREELAAATQNLRYARAGGVPSQVTQAEAELRKAQIDRERLLRDRAALEKLVAKQAAPKDDLEQNRLDLAKADAELQRATEAREELNRRAHADVQRYSLLVERGRNDVAVLEERVRSSSLTSPVDGTLFSLPVHAGDYVRTGDLLADVADLRHLRVRVFVDEPELGILEPGQAVDITWDALPGTVWPGRTDMVPRQVVPRGNRSVGELLCSISNDKLELIPNINVSVRIRARERSNALVVPRGAVSIEGAHSYVFVVSEGRLGVGNPTLQKREVRVGISSASHYEILSGLNEGESVAIPGDVELRDGMAISPATS